MVTDKALIRDEWLSRDLWQTVLGDTTVTMIDKVGEGYGVFPVYPCVATPQLIKECTFIVFYNSD